MTSQTGTRLQFDRTLDAPVDKVYEAISSKSAIAKWFGPSDDMRVTVHAWDFKVGGRYKVEFNTPTGETHTCHGDFKEIVPQKKVSYTWAWEEQPPMDTLVSIVLEKNGEKTNLKLTHDGFPAEDVRDHHEQGWLGSYERLARLVS